MMEVFAEFEGEIIRERIHAGIARARAQGRHLGRPRIEGEAVECSREALATGASLSQAIKAPGCSIAVVHRVRSEL
jgi:DNA invertase Pin-like site-specific DNA recombinase